MEVLSGPSAVQLPGTGEEEREPRSGGLAGSPVSLRKCPEEEEGAGGLEGRATHPLLTPNPSHPPSPFSPTPQSISDAFLHSGNKRGNSISSTVGPCEISFACPGQRSSSLSPDPLGPPASTPARLVYRHVWLRTPKPTQ